MNPLLAKVDSPEGIAFLMEIAREQGLVLNLVHEDIARRHGVSTEGIRIARPISIHEPRTIPLR